MRPLPRDADERGDDCVGIYHKSLLYLVSESFEEDEEKQRRLLGLARNVDRDYRDRTREVDTDVKKWLEAKSPANFPAGRVRVFAHGATQPLAPNTSADGRAKNRRVEIVLGAES